MKEAIRMYHLFFPRKWLLLMVYLLYPAVMIAAFGLVLKLTLKIGVILAIAVSASLFVIMEFFVDAYMLYGIGAKENGALEYIKSSSKGVRLLKWGINVDGIRRLITVVIIMAGSYLVAQYEYAHAGKEWTFEINGNLGIWCYIQFGIIMFFLTEFGMLFTRRTRNVLVNLLFAYLMSSLSCSLVLLVAENCTWITVLVSGILLVGLMVFSRRLIIKRVRESYYDEGNNTKS